MFELSQCEPGRIAHSSSVSKVLIALCICMDRDMTGTYINLTHSGDNYYIFNLTCTSNAYIARL